MHIFEHLQEHCVALSRVNYTNFALSLFLLIGILVSYLPQHHRIISRRSSFGLSPYFVLLGTTSGTCAFANILVLPTSRADIACCHEINGFQCFAGLLGIAQVGMQWSCFTIILLLFLIFFPRATPAIPPPKPTTPISFNHSNADEVDGDEIPATVQPSFRTALTVVAVCVVHAMIIFILSCYFVLAHPSSLQSWANFLGIFSTVLASVQYFPQIYTTFLLKRVGSLSIPMMCIQTPGSFVWAGSLAARLGGQGWSAWGVYVVTGCLQGTLLVMGSYFELMHRRKEREMRSSYSEYNGAPDAGTGSTAAAGSERTPLLSNED